MKMTVDVEMRTEPQNIDLDTIYSEIGEFGKQQVFHFVLLAIPITLACTMLFNYFFVSAVLDYRYYVNWLSFLTYFLRCLERNKHMDNTKLVFELLVRIEPVRRLLIQLVWFVEDDAFIFFCVCTEHCLFIVA